MRDTVLFNERYCTVEIDRDGIISGYNNNARSVISDLFKLQKSEDLNGLSICKFSDSFDSGKYDSSVPEKIISCIDELTLIDTIHYDKTGSVIVRFVRDNDEFSSYFNFIKFSSSLFLELDKEQNIIFASELFLKTASAGKSEIYGENISALTDKQGSTKIGSAVALCRENISGFTKIDQLQMKFGGSVRCYDIEASAVKDGNGAFSGLLCCCSDTSFEKRCGVMNRSIRKMSAIANFAGGIAHDYNNALTAVLGNISLAKMDAGKNSELEELLRDAESAGMKIKTLTERLGMFARGMKPAKEKTDIGSLVQNSLPEMFCGYKGRYTVSFQENMTSPEIDPVLVREAICHVIENAVDAVDNTDGKIEISVEEGEINKQAVFRETSLVAGRYIIISVKDNGAGIESSHGGEIFDPYISTKAGRDGLGLALAYTILKRHRGFISAENAGDGGALFKIYLPLF